MNLRQLDLNLLLVLDSLMNTRSVSRTAADLHRTQPAISHALQRLRDQLDDPLLVRQGGVMVPSPKAEQIMGLLRPLLRQMEQALHPIEIFNPSTSTRLFRLVMMDFLAGLFPDLLHLMRESAPNIRLQWGLSQSQVFEHLIEGSVDIYLGPHPIETPSGIAVEPVGGLSWGCFMHDQHPAQKKWGKRAWCQQEHVVVGVDDGIKNPVSRAADALGLTRKVGVMVPVFAAVAPILATTDFLATLPRSVMRDQLRPWSLLELPAPFPIPPINHALYCADRLRGDGAISWFLDKLRVALTPFMDTPLPTKSNKKSR